MLSNIFPTIYEFTSPFVLHLRTKEVQFFINSMKDTIDNRKKTGLKRNDFVDLLLALEDTSYSSSDFEIFLTAQAVLFFAAGFETSASTISNLYYELAMNPSIQEKLRLEIASELEADNGKFTYENIKRMNYLDKLVKGTRFANYQTKIGIIALIRKFKVDFCDKTPIPIRIIPRGVVPVPEGGIHLRISKVEDDMNDGNNNNDYSKVKN